MIEIQIFILTYNRPHLILNAINSVLNQDNPNFELIVSDNSTNYDTENLIKETYPNRRFKYVKRDPPLGTAHFNIVLSEVTADYFMIFHDDDIMHVRMVGILYHTLIKNKDVVAVGSNANIIKNGRAQNRKFFRNLKKDIKITTIEQIIEAYSKPAFVPFPSYMYRNEVARHLKINLEHGSKYCDVAFIIDILTLGPIIFIADSLMDYYIHENQDSYAYDFEAFSHLINYIRKEYNYSRKHNIIRRMRIQNIYGELKYNLLNKKLSLYSKRLIILNMVLFRYSTFEYFPKILIISISKLFSRGKNNSHHLSSINSN